MTLGRSKVGIHHFSNASRGRPRWLSGAIAGLVVLGALTSTAQPARADDLDDQQTALQGQITQSDQAVVGYVSRLDEATAAVVSSHQALADAQAVLAKATSLRDVAAAVDAQKANELAIAEQDLGDAKSAVAIGKDEVERQEAKAVTDLRTTRQQDTAMMSVGMLFVEYEDAGDVSSRVQWASTLYNSNAAEVNRLTELQLQLLNAQTNMATLEDKARVVREAAAAHLSITQAAEQAATDAANKVSDLLAANQTAEANANQVLADERANNVAMQAEMDSVTQRIQERNERRAAEEAARRAAEEAARRAAEAEAAAQAQREAEARAAEGRAAAERQVYNAPAPAPAAAVPASGFPLATPAYGPYTSPFGWRTNPVLGYSELHDGLDIGASCGSPLYAAADGRVTDMYYGGGWGWKLIIDNGWIDGVQVSTGYNHAQGYIVSPGQWVSRGQVVGYTGTTGLSTGCHLHFHVWVNGQVTNPVNYV